MNIKVAFPRVIKLNDFDICQKNYFISKNASDLSKKLPKGKFFKTVTKDEIKLKKKEESDGNTKYD